MELNTPKGTRDFPPEEKLFRDTVVERLRALFERYGFLPLETPVLERYDVLSAKYAGGSEILKETFTLDDQGGRKLGLRYDLTVPLARFVAMNQDLKMPFKRYQIGTVYRDGPVKLGRYREFYQCDADIIGADSALADAQCMQLGKAFFADLLPCRAECNNMALLRMILEQSVPEERMEQAMLTLDKLKKIGPDKVKEELAANDIPSESVEELITISQLNTNEEKITSICERYGQSDELQRVKDVLDLVEAEFNPSLSRGLSYYTGMVYEFYTEGMASSLAAGGRYDRMIGQFVGQPGRYPAVGISFGLEPITEALKIKGTVQERTTTQVFVIPIGTDTESAVLTEELRDAGLNADMDLMARGVSKNLDYADSQGIPFAVLLGPKEIESGQATVKDMRSGEDTGLPREELVARLKERL